MTGLPPPNHTQVPNILLDVMMLDMSESELKVTLAIVRKTLGWHKKKDQISYSQLEKLTGMGRQAVSTGIEAALKRGLIEIVGTGSRGVNIFGLVIDDQYENHTSEPIDQYENHTRTSMKIKHTKETTQKKKDISAEADAQDSKSEKPKKQREPNPIFDAVALGSFGLSKMNGDKTVGAMVGKIVKWLKEQDDVTPKQVTEFYDWYADETDDSAAPRDAGKFAVWWSKFAEADENSSGDGWDSDAAFNKIFDPANIIK